MGFYERNWGLKYWWLKNNILIGISSPFHLNKYMSRVRFEEILTWIKYTDEVPPHYVDRLFHIRMLVEAWNYIMSTNFILGWIS